MKINAIHVPEGAGPELEKRFANRAHSVDGSKGFLGFQLLRPVKGDERYFVVTQWESEEDFQAWAAGPAREAPLRRTRQACRQRRRPSGVRGRTRRETVCLTIRVAAPASR